MKAFTGKINQLVLQGAVEVILSDQSTQNAKMFRISSENPVQLVHQGETLTLSSPPGIRFGSSSTGISISGGSVSIMDGGILVNGKRFEPESLESEKDDKETDEKEKENESKVWMITNEKKGGICRFTQSGSSSCILPTSLCSSLIKIKLSGASSMEMGQSSSSILNIQVSLKGSSKLDLKLCEIVDKLTARYLGGKFLSGRDDL